MTLMILGEFLGFFLGALAVWLLLPEGATSAAATLRLALMFGGAAANSLAVRFAFRHIGARCACCGGRAVPRGIRPITYCCDQCGHTHETNVRSNW